MYGLIAGDVIGSVYEHRRVASYDFPLFHPWSTWTDDTVLGLAVVLQLGQWLGDARGRRRTRIRLARLCLVRGTKDGRAHSRSS